MRTVLRRPRALLRDRRGVAAIFLAGGLAFMLGCAALAIDTASLYLASRKLQGAADSAALAAAGNLPGASAAATQAIGDDYASPAAVSLDLATGTYTPDPALTPAARFAANGASPNAAKATLSTSVQLFFGIATLGRRDVQVSRAATATRTNLAAFSIGSRLASLDGGVANALTGALAGSTVSLDVMDYQAMANATVNLFGFISALRTAAGLTAGSFNDTLSASVSAPTVLNALASALSQQGTASAASAIRTIAAADTMSGPIQLNQLINLGPTGTQDRVGSTSVGVDAWDLARAVLQTAAAGRQLQLNLGSGVAGLAQTTVYLSVGSPSASSPWLAITGNGQPIVRTAQTRLYIDTVVGTANLGLAGLAQVRMPLYIELAAAQAQLSALSCNQRAGTEAITLSVQPSIGHASIAAIPLAQLSNMANAVTESPAQVVSLPLVSVTGSARLDLSNGQWQTVSFDQADVAAGTVKTVSSSGTVSAIAASLANQAQLTATIAGIPLPAPVATQAVAGALNTGAPALDALTGAMLSLLGIHLGQADVRVDGVRCGAAVLVG